MGVSFWPKMCGPNRITDRETFSHHILQGMNKSMHNADDQSSAGKLVMWAARWVDGACRIIDTSADYWNAMARTDLAKSAQYDLEVPWPAFVVRLPHGVLRSPQGWHAKYILVGERYDIFGAYMPLTFWILGPTVNDAILVSELMSLSDFLFETDRDAKGMPEALPCIDEATRAIVGLLFTMQHTIHFTDGNRSSGIAKRPLRSEPPPHRSIVIGRPINFRAAPNESHGSTGEGSSSAFQSLVRGHIKRQVCGLNRTGRKVVWIEPYWRGPEDAPILSRPYMVNP